MTSELPELKFKKLTKRGKDGQLYHRREVVERQLAEIEQMGPDELARRVSVRRESSGGSLKSEALVALFREVVDYDFCAEVLETINRRVFAILYGYRWKFDNRDTFEEFAQAVELTFLEKILDKSDRADYAQVSFGDFVDKLATNELRKFERRSEIEEMTTWIDHSRFEDDDLPKFQLKAGGLTPEEDLLLREMILLLPQPIRAAWILHRFCGWKIQSDDPSEPTLDKHFEKTERTIRNWIKKADETLAEGGGL